MTAATTCHECSRRPNGSCERCQRPTCNQHYFEREHLGLCTCCADELQAEIDRTGLYLSNWPHPVRKPLPGLGDPDELTT